MSGGEKLLVPAELPAKPDGWARQMEVRMNFGKDENGDATPPRWTWLPSIRVHLIQRPDSDRHLRDHPWNARTIVLEGWYTEERYHEMKAYGGPERKCHIRTEGYTGRLLFGQYHRIVRVSNDGVYTLFFTWKHRGTWGFDVNGIKIPWREYLARKDLR